MIKASPYVENLFHTMTGNTLVIAENEIRSHVGYSNSFVLQKLGELNAHDNKGRVYKQVLISGSLDDSEIKNCVLPLEPIYQFYTSKEYIGFMEVVLENN